MSKTSTQNATLNKKKFLFITTTLFLLCLILCVIGILTSIVIKNANTEENTEENVKYKEVNIVDLAECNKDLENENIEVKGYFIAPKTSLFCFNTCSLTFSSDPQNLNSKIATSVKLTKSEEGTNNVQIPSVISGIDSFKFRDKDGLVINPQKETTIKGKWVISENSTEQNSKCSLNVEIIEQE